MSTAKIPTEPDALLAIGLKNLWFPICPSHLIAAQPVSMRRLGIKLALWRDSQGRVQALEDHCPHRGAPLSRGVAMGDRIACPYHGVQVRGDGTVMMVPGSPGCRMEGLNCVRSFPVQERHGAVWLYNSHENIAQPPPLRLPEELEGEAYAHFLCYAEWRGDYRYVLDNVVDPMHGTFLHKQSHSMAEGDATAKFRIRETGDGFVFEKEGQRDVNFDWTEWADTGTHWVRLEIPYPKTGGPGGNFIIIGAYTPISAGLSAVFHWRCRKVDGWQRDTWRFLYKNRLEARHWAVLEQDRLMMEDMEPDANQREMLYQHDMGVVRLRRHLRSLATRQIAELTAPARSPS